MKNIVKSFLKNNGGNFAIIFGLVLTPVAMSVGLAVDYAGYKRLDNRMSLATEAAMLAGSKHVVFLREQDYAENGEFTLTNAQLVAELDSVFKPFFEANFAAGGYELSTDQYILEYIEADNNTKVRVTMKYGTGVMFAFGTETMYSTREMIINLKVQPNNYIIDIVMCIDATGSMQNTLNAVKASAMTFNQDLREEIGVGADSEKVKIRIRPIFYRDWEEGRTYQQQMVTYNAAYSVYLEELEDYDPSGANAAEELKEELGDDWNASSWYYKNGSNWKKSTKSWNPKTHKRVQYEGSYYYFTSIAALENWVDGLSGLAGGEPPVEPVKPVNHGLNIYGDFIDLDPNESSGFTKTDQNSALTSFLGSTNARGGADLPEAAGACMNEAIRSDWFDNQSAEAREYFKVPASDVIIKEGDDIPDGSYTKITPIPVVVFWSDASINSLSLSRQYLSPTTPTSWLTFKDLWNGTIPAGDPESSWGVAADDSGRPVIDTDYRMAIHFGPENASGFTTIRTWDKAYYGGSLTTGNNEAVKVIAKKLLEALPDLLRIGS